MTCSRCHQQKVRSDPRTGKHADVNDCVAALQARLATLDETVKHLVVHIDRLGEEVTKMRDFLSTPDTTDF